MENWNDGTRIKPLINCYDFIYHYSNIPKSHYSQNEAGINKYKKLLYLLLTGRHSEKLQMQGVQIFRNEAYLGVRRND